MKKLKKTLKHLLIFAFLPLFSHFLLHSASAFEEGMQFLNNEKAQNAIECFDEALKAEDCPKDVYLYLGIAYLRLGLYTEAIDSFARGKNYDEENFHLYAFNLGNVFFAQNRFYDAEISYNEAISSVDTYAPALLNRANARMKIEKYIPALADYKEYLRLRPNDKQKEGVKQMIELLEKIKKEDDERRESLLQEAERRAEEAMRKREEERSKKLLEEINSSLSSVDGASSVSSGTEETIDYEEESNLD